MEVIEVMEVMEVFDGVIVIIIKLFNPTLQGDPVDVIRVLSKKFSIQKLCFDQNSEPIWLDRDNAVKNFCGTHRIQAGVKKDQHSSSGERAEFIHF